MNVRLFRRLALGASLALALASGLAAQDARMLDTRSGALEWALLERIAEGRVAPTTVQSLSVAEAEFYGLSTGLQTAGDLDFGGRISVQPYLLGWSGLQTENRMTDTSYLSRFRIDEPVLLIGLTFSRDSFYGSADIDFGTDSLARYAGSSGISGFWKPLDYLSYWTFPAESYMAWSGRNLTFAAGRLGTGIGLGHTNILLNGQARWYDQAQFSWWSTKFRFFALWGTSASHLNEAEHVVQSYSAQNSDSWGWDTVNNHDAATQALVPFKMFTYHRFEFKPNDRLGLGFSEMQLIGGKVPDLTNLLPTVTWHNTYTAGTSNVMLHVDAWYVPVDGVQLFAEYLMDDSQAPSESGASKPNCWAWALGTTVVLPLPVRNWRFSATVEYNHADRWTYARWQPYLTMYQRQMITGGSQAFDIPLGHPEGGDVDQAGIRLVALARDGRRVELSYTFISKGPVYLGMIVPNPDYDPGEAEYLPVYYDYDDLTGTPGSLDALLGHVRKLSHVFGLKAAWPLGERVEANGEIDFRLIFNAGHVTGKRATETVYKAGLKWTYGD